MTELSCDLNRCNLSEASLADHGLLKLHKVSEPSIQVRCNMECKTHNTHNYTILICVTVQSTPSGCKLNSLLNERAAHISVQNHSAAFPVPAALCID